MRNFRRVEVIQNGDSFTVRVGAGCQIKHLLAKLQEQGLTLPSIGLITEQTIAGATSTGTHGSGKQSLSHFITAAHIAGYHQDTNNHETNKASIKVIDEGDELRAARCALGCLGVVVAIELPCVPQYNVLERIRACDTVEEALESESEWPLQQFFILPHRWKCLVQERIKSDAPRSWTTPFYRAYWFLGLDLLLHLLVLLFAVVCRSRKLIHFLYKFILPTFVIRNWRVVDRSDKMLVMEHEMFRHLELEGFVKKENIVEALRFVELVLKQADGSLEDQLDAQLSSSLEEAGLLQDFHELKGTYTHHYPICIRRVLQDDTLIFMASGDSECWYAISFITYLKNRDSFYRLATFLAKSLLVLYGGRIHWGKWFPMNSSEIDQMYPSVNQFREIVRQHDPNGVFQNRFVKMICQPDSSESSGTDK